MNGADAPAFALPPANLEPIFEALTSPGEGAIATLLLDGEGLFARLDGLFRGKTPLDPKASGQLVLGRILDSNGQTVDEAVAAVIPKEESETGAAQVELSCHGGLGASEAVTRALVGAGFRPARPGELMTRAHRAAKLGLLEIEARLRLPLAATARQTELLLNVRAFQSHWERQGMEAALGARERRIDWREGLHREAAAALDASAYGLALLARHRVAVAGPVNAGKSTLTNRLLRAQASIVSAAPGTTRDVLERPASVRGLSLVLADTAGLRELAGAGGDASVEREGMARARGAAEAAGLTLLVLDGSRAPEEDEMAALEALASRPHLLVLNKADQGTHAEASGLAFALGSRAFAVSALTGEGLAELEAAMEDALLSAPSPYIGAPGAPPAAAFTHRQAAWLAAIKLGLEQGLDGSGLVGHIRNLVGTRPNEEELAAVFAEASRGTSGR
ncbi:MAG: 50S ribosome-binding GTPase [Planctomycetota bacterium]|nr:50S ribosome-binding GTPase [Planctomycetota bacterium]